MDRKGEYDMDELISLIPRNKHDLENVKRLKELDPADVKPILPELLPWIQILTGQLLLRLRRF